LIFFGAIKNTTVHNEFNNTYTHTKKTIPNIVLWLAREGKLIRSNLLE